MHYQKASVSNCVRILIEVHNFHLVLTETIFQYDLAHSSGKSDKCFSKRNIYMKNIHARAINHLQFG